MDYYNIALAVYFMIVLFGIYNGFGEKRRIVIFSNYDDLALTFLIPVSYFLIFFSFKLLGGQSYTGHYIGLSIALLLFLRLLLNTFLDNQKNILKTTLAIATKVPLGLIWVLQLLQLLNPSGTTARQRQGNRGMAIFVLTFLTPLIAKLVVNKTGSLFNPASILSGRRNTSAIKDSLNE